MARNYVAAYYHIVWSTKNHEPLLSTDEYRINMKNHLAMQFQKNRCKVYEIGVMADHIHSVVAIPPSERISEVIGHVKGETAFVFCRDETFVKWQEGYGVTTFAKTELQKVCEYVANQQQHHGNNQIWPSLEKVADDAEWETSSI